MIISLFVKQKIWTKMNIKIKRFNCRKRDILRKVDNEFLKMHLCEEWLFFDEERLDGQRDDEDGKEY